MKRLLGFLSLLILVALGLSFALLNSEPVLLDYYFDKQEIPLSLLLVGALAVGALLGVLASTGILFRQKRKASKLNRQVVSLEKEVLKSSETALK
ncbi:MAG: LapA family protein [Gammaproteobacteria bacterium]